MANHRLDGQRVAVLATDGFEQSELEKPVEALRAEGATVDVVSLKTGAIQGMEHDKKGRKTTVDKEISSADAADYDALVLPGGVANPDTLRTVPKAVDFVRSFAEANKPIAAICHGPWTLINAEAVEGRKMTSWPSLQVDLENAGADWVDEEVVVDRGLVTSRNPGDLPAFCDKMIETFAEGRRQPDPQPGASI
jgi:protease I